jgi:hypothetical protein
MIERYNLSRTTWECLIDDWIFNERDRKILKRRLLDGICFEPLAEEFELSVRQVKAIVYKSQKRLFEIVDKSL